MEKFSPSEDETIWSRPELLVRIKKAPEPSSASGAFLLLRAPRHLLAPTTLASVAVIARAVIAGSVPARAIGVNARSPVGATIVTRAISVWIRSVKPRTWVNIGWRACVNRGANNHGANPDRADSDPNHHPSVCRGGRKRHQNR